MDARDVAKKISRQFAGSKGSTKVSLVDGAVCVVDSDIARAAENDPCQWLVVAELADSVDLRGCVILYRGVSGLWERLIVNDDKTITETQALGYWMTPEEALKQLKALEIQGRAE
jgi:hypothetical protein